MPKILVGYRVPKSMEDYEAARIKSIHRQLYPENHIMLKSYEVESYERTQEQWRQFLEDNGYNPDETNIRSCEGNKFGKRCKYMRKKDRKGKGGGFRLLYPKEGMP